jgi:hypothetical protein
MSQHLTEHMTDTFDVAVIDGPADLIAEDIRGVVIVYRDHLSAAPQHAMIASAA